MDIISLYRYRGSMIPRLSLCVALSLATLVACSDDSTVEDTGVLADSGQAMDAAPMDASPLDTGVGLDASPTDLGSTDSGDVDAGPIDSGDFDGGQVDMGIVDAGEVDAGETDTGVMDSGAADSGTRTTIFPGFCPSTDTAPGLYQGTLASNLNDIASASCVGATPGRDGALRVTVPNGATLSVTYQSAGDGILYILDSCPVASSCLVGADNSISGPETVSWTNTGGADNPVYVVLDTADINEPSTFTLDLSVQ